MTPPARLILASTSPHRRLLLERLGVPFAAENPGVEEAILASEPPRERAMRLAMEKAQAVSDRHPDALVIGGDQVACTGSVLLEKPGDPARARAQLARLSGAVALFHTACAVVCRATAFSASHVDSTGAVFRQLTPAEIERYVSRDQPLDCAGSFKAEALGISLLERIEGVDPTSLIGLPLIWLAATLRQAGHEVP